MANVFLKDPDATLDYAVDWSGWLGSDTIGTSTWTTALPNGTASISGGTALVWLTGGTPGVFYTVANKIVTAAGRTDERTFVVKVESR